MHFRSGLTLTLHFAFFFLTDIFAFLLHLLCEFITLFLFLHFYCALVARFEKLRFGTGSFWFMVYLRSHPNSMAVLVRPVIPTLVPFPYYPTTLTLHIYYLITFPPLLYTHIFPVYNAIPVWFPIPFCHGSPHLPTTTYYLQWFFLPAFPLVSFLTSLWFLGFWFHTFAFLPLHIHMLTTLPVPAPYTHTFAHTHRHFVPHTHTHIPPLPPPLTTHAFPFTFYTVDLSRAVYGAWRAGV